MNHTRDCSVQKFEKVFNTLALRRTGCKILGTGRGGLCLRLLWIAGFCLVPVSAWAEMQSANAQAHTLSALRAIDKAQWSEAKTEAVAAHDALASKLYYWLLFTRKDDFSPYPQLTRFVRQNPEWPEVETLRKKIESAMPEGLSPSEIIGWYREYPPETVKAVDRYAGALIAGDRPGEARAFLSDWWVTTNLSQEDQRFIFRKYNRFLDREAHLRRFDAMLLRGQTGNPRALAEMLGAGYPALAEARIALANGAADASAKIAQVPRILQGDAGLLFERLRFRRKNNLDVEAMEILNHPPPPEKILNPQDWWKERHIIIRRLLERKMFEGASLLAQGHGLSQGPDFAEAEWLAGWLALRFLNKPTAAYEHFEVMYQSVETPVSKARGAYWAGRAAEALGDKDHAKHWYREAARYQTVFYGQMAASHLGMHSALPHAAPPQIESGDLSAFEGNDLIQAYTLLRKAGMGREARKFLKAFIQEEENPKRYRYAAELAVDAGELYEAVRISKDATAKGMFLTAQSYPVITGRLEGISLEWSLVHAIIRQESMFDFDARSPVGALGLMQLMPATAREVAKKLGLYGDTEKLTSDPNYNIQLGSRYLSDLVNRFDGSYAMAIAGYNAGPARVSQWVDTFGDPRTNQIDLVDWIEMIPISETRNYVQRVLEGVYVYRLRLKDVQKPPSFPIHVAMGTVDGQK